jgi:putative SOS response-associated peptidase YedK
MCGRYVFTSPLEAIQAMFKFDQMTNLGPNYNVAPTHEMPIVRRKKGDRRNELIIARWGLIPHWAKDTKIGYSTINARSETAAAKPAFRDAFKRRRALIPADGYFEWKRDGKQKQPYLIRMKGGGPFAFAGLWATWRPPEGEEMTSYTIMTTEPNELMKDIHDRMPVILGPDDHDRWLDLDADSTELLKPYPSEWLEAYPVDKRVGNVRNNDVELVEPLG